MLPDYSDSPVLTGVVAQGLLPSKRDCYLLAQTVLRGFASWFCSRPAWTVGEASATLRKRYYVEIQESYDGVAVIHRGCIEDYFTEGGHLCRVGFGTVCRIECGSWGLSRSCWTATQVLDLGWEV